MSHWNATSFVYRLVHGGGGARAIPVKTAHRPCATPPTNLVYLSIGAISNNLHQFEYPSWVLWRRKEKKDEISAKHTKKGAMLGCCVFFLFLLWATASGASQLLRPVPNASRTKEKADSGNTSPRLSGHFQHGELRQRTDAGEADKKNLLMLARLWGRVFLSSRVH